MLKQNFKKNQILWSIYRIYRILIAEFRFSNFVNIIWFIKLLCKFGKCTNLKFVRFEIYPCLNDSTHITPVEPVYFYQDAWAAGKIFELKPKHLYDVGSSVKTIGILSQFVPVTIIDIRSPLIKFPSLHFIKGSILSLPFKNNSIEIISSLCVVEHIGLGRYGDEIDVFGSEKAIAELKRVVKYCGIILISVPVDRENTIYFNAHRAFTRDYILELFDGWELIEEKYIYGYEIIGSYSRKDGFGTGLFMFMKKEM